MAISPSLKNKLNLQDLAKDLQEKLTIRSGGTPAIIQGAAPITTDICAVVTAWLKTIK